jgi:hypothetical protein
MMTAKQKSIRTLSDMDLEHSYSKALIRKPSYAAELRGEMERRKKSVRIKKNPRRRSGGISPGEANQILSGLEDDKADFHSLRSDEVNYLLDAAKEIGYRAPKNASGSKARSFYSFLQTRRRSRVNERTGKAIERVKHNPRGKVISKRVRRPAQTRRRSGFPGYIVTFIVPDAIHLKRQYIGGAPRRLTVVYKRKAAAVFSTTDKAKNAVRSGREWFNKHGVSKVTILRTNESAASFQ